MFNEIGFVAKLVSMYLAFKSSTQGMIQAGAMKAKTSLRSTLNSDLHPPLKQLNFGVGSRKHQFSF